MEGGGGWGNLKGGVGGVWGGGGGGRARLRVYVRRVSTSINSAGHPVILQVVQVRLRRLEPPRLRATAISFHGGGIHRRVTPYQRAREFRSPAL